MSESGSSKGSWWSYVLVHGILGWGIPFFGLMLAWDYFEKGGWPDGVQIATLGCISAFGGFVLGNWMWKGSTTPS